MKQKGKQKKESFNLETYLLMVTFSLWGILRESGKPLNNCGCKLLMTILNWACECVIVFKTQMCRQRHQESKKKKYHKETLKASPRGVFWPVSEEGHLRMVKMELRSSSSSGRPFCKRWSFLRLSLRWCFIERTCWIRLSLALVE